MKITANFMKSVPLEKRALVQKKLVEFSTLIPDKKTLSDIPAGFWIRKIVGTDIYKFRVNSGDRILFHFGEEGDIVFLSFQSHDNQIRVARGVRKSEQLVDFQINETTYEQEQVDETIDAYMRQEILQHMQEIEQQEVFEDEYIELAVAENSTEFVFTLEQFECIKQYDAPIIVWGCAGSGKTSIALRKAVLNSTLALPTLYVTKSPRLIDKVKALCPTNEQLAFQSLQQLLTDELAYKAQLVQFAEFKRWLVSSSTIDELKGFSERELWIEINSIIKGQIVDERMMTQAQYLACTQSNFNERMKRHIYLLASKYQFWLQKNTLYDFNDLAYFALQKSELTTYPFVICDEVQEFTKKQLALLLKLAKNHDRLVLLGDETQCTDNYHFDLLALKQQLYSEGHQLQQYIITKNYRSPDKIVDVLNFVKDVKAAHFSYAKSERDVAVRSGVYPNLVRLDASHYSLLQQAQNDSQTVIIVADTYTKHQLQEQKITRVFTIEETRGLEYEHAYLVNVLSNFKEVWTHIFNESQDIHLYTTYLNLLYLAMTRSKQSVTILEEQETVMEQMLRAAIPFQEEMKTQFTESSALEWLQEADKLFELQQYEQAAYAYERAGELDKMQLALRLQNHTQFTQFEEQFNTYLRVQLDKFTPYHLEMILKVMEKKGYELKGRMRIEASYKNILGSRISELFIPMYMDRKEAATNMYELLSESVLLKEQLLFEVTLFQNGVPIQLDQKNFEIVISGSRVTVRTMKSANIEQRFQTRDFMNKQFNERNDVIQGNYGFLFREVEKERITSLTSEQILNNIFKK